MADPGYSGAKSTQTLKGRGAQHNPPNPFVRDNFSIEELTAVDEWETIAGNHTRYIKETPASIINKITSPDLRFPYSVNLYQGCEHGCIYCYARNVHQYWGYGAGIDFERKIIYKANAPHLLRQAFDAPNWKGEPVTFSGNTDCYQPAERQFRLTRQMLEVCLEYRNPVSIITKNSLILRDLDILTALNQYHLVSVAITITTLDESLRLKMEPRTSTSDKRLKTVKILSENKIPVMVMMAPVIPGLNDHEIPAVLEAAASHGALDAAYQILRLNGHVATLFQDWLTHHYPSRAGKVLRQVAACHGGSLNDSRFGLRLKGEGNIADTIRQMFNISRKRFFGNSRMPSLDSSQFRKPGSSRQLSLF